MNVPLTFAEAIDLHRRGRFAELLERCPATELNLSKIANATHRVLLAEALLLSGDPIGANAIATRDSQASSSDSLRARLETVRALADKKAGNFESAERRLQNAVRISRQCRDTWVCAWCELHLFRLLTDGYRDSQLAALLSEVRRSVIRTADPQLTALLHDSVAIMEGQAGRRDEARRHLHLATSILNSDPHAWVEFAIHSDAFCVAWVDCDYREAAIHLRKARSVSPTIFGKRVNETVEVNQAHLDLMTGNFPAAKAAFERTLAQPRSAIQLSALDGLARMHLALGSLDDCEALTRQCVSAGHDSPLRVYYPVRWSRACAIRALIRQGRWSEAVENTRSELQLALQLQDAPLTASLLLLQAEAVHLSGNPALAGDALFRALSLGVTSLRELQGQAYLSCGKVLAESNASRAQMLAERAARVWRRQGDLWSQIAETAERVGRRLELRKFLQRDILEFRPGESAACLIQTPGTVAADVLNCVVAAFEMAYDPALASAELMELARMSGCAEHLKISSGKSASEPNTLHSDLAVELQASTRSGALLASTMPPDPSQAIIVSDLLALARTVVEVGRLRADERKRAALWPVEAAVESDSLFLSNEMLALAATARKVAPTTVPVLITGETGTGKEILARAVHAASTRAKAAFLPFNCSAGPRDMIDAQLFGHRRGAFTGAVEHAPGIVRSAAGGTLFLDEIGEAPLEVQPKLLRFLESGEIHPVGEPHPIKVDVRVIAATNIDLDAAVSSGRFREDLFYRLNIVRLHLPPLRERRVEVPIFAQHYLRKHARELGKGDLRLAEETMEYLLLYKWPGNVRQLANEMRKLAALAETDAVLMPEHLSREIVASRRTVPASERTLDSNEVVVRIDQPLAAATEHLERVMLPYALKQCDGKVEEAARMLGLSRKGLYLKRLRLGLDVAGPQAKSA